MRGITTKQFSELLLQYGWQIGHRKSSHITFVKTGVNYHITIVQRKGEISRPLAQRLLKQAGIQMVG